MLLFTALNNTKNITSGRCIAGAKISSGCATWCSPLAFLVHKCTSFNHFLWEKYLHLLKKNVSKRIRWTMRLFSTKNVSKRRCTDAATLKYRTVVHTWQNICLQPSFITWTSLVDHYSCNTHPDAHTVLNCSKIVPMCSLEPVLSFPQVPHLICSPLFSQTVVPWASEHHWLTQVVNTITSCMEVLWRVPTESVFILFA